MGVVRIAAGLERAIRPLTLVAMIPPVDRAARRLEEMAIRRNEAWREARTESARVAELFADAVVPQLVDAVVDRLDLTDLVLERVDLRAVISSIDLDEIVGRVDVTAIIDGLDIDAVAARVDVQKIVDRLDLVAIADGVIEELDLARDHPRVDRDDGGGNGRWHPCAEHARGPIRRTRRGPDAAPSQRGKGSTDPHDPVKDES